MLIRAKKRFDVKRIKPDFAKANILSSTPIMCKRNLGEPGSPLLMSCKRCENIEEVKSFIENRN